MKIIGIIGGIGAGKSMISHTFANLYNAYVIELDKIGHRVMLKDGPAFGPVVALFGEDILDSDGEIDRKRVSDLVFGDEAKLEDLNAIVHKAVFEDLRQHLNTLSQMSDYDFVICEAAVLVVDQFLPLLDELWYVRADKAIRKERLKIQRHMDDAKIEAIMASQHDDAFYGQHADLIIDNSGDIAKSFEKIHERVHRLLEG